MKTFSRTLVGKEAREALKRGIDQVAIPTSATLGASGRNSAYRDFGMPVISNDGVSIARKINPEDKFESIGADLIKQASEQTNFEAGDGTTSTIVLAHALIEEGIKAIDGGANPMELRRELNLAKDEAVASLKEISVPIKNDKDLLNVAQISVENEKIAEIVVEAVRDAGTKGAVIVEDSPGYDIEKEKLSGYFWGKGYVSPYMITNERNEAILEDVPVIVTDKFLNLNKELMMTINELLKQGHKSALVIADKVEGELLQSIILNKMKSIFTTICVQRPATLAELEDIAIVTKATAITKDKGIKDIMINHIGIAKKVIVKKDSTTIIGQDSEKLHDRILEIEKALGEDKENEGLKERLAKLAGGIVMLRVGAKTEVERKYLRLKIDDAVSACRSAIEEGIVAGAGVTLKTLAEKSTNDLFKVALVKPFEKILENAEIKNDGKTYNVLTGKAVKDVVKEGIIDATKVIRCEIENAVSLAGVFLTLESVTCEFEEEKKS